MDGEIAVATVRSVGRCNQDHCEAVLDRCKLVNSGRARELDRVSLILIRLGPAHGSERYLIRLLRLSLLPQVDRDNFRQLYPWCFRCTLRPP